MSLAIAMILDALLGEPDAIWRRVPHPAVLLGRLIDWFEARLNQGLNRRMKGAVTLAGAVSIAAVIGFAIEALPLSPVAEIIAAAILLAQKSLADHVKAVATGLQSGLAEGRAEVAKIVGRDTAALDEAGVARAAIESGAENLSDGVVAPAFWFLVFGLPGMLAYKAINTADSMIGYRNERYAEFGWAAAKADDLVNLIPARLTALLFCLAAFSMAPWRAALRDAHLHRSPNAGWPEAAMAASIDVALAGPRSYDGRMTDDPFVNQGGNRTPGAADIGRAVAMLWRVWFALLAVVIAAHVVF